MEGGTNADALAAANAMMTRRSIGGRRTREMDGAASVPSDGTCAELPGIQPELSSRAGSYFNYTRYLTTGIDENGTGDVASSRHLALEVE